MAGTTTLLCVTLGAFCAYALARLEFRFKRTILGLILAVTMFPQISIVSPLYLVLRELRLINTYPGLILPYMTFAMPLTVWLLVGFFRQLPREMEEAAMAYLERYADDTGHFGCLAAEDDPAIFAALFAAAENWLRGKGLKRATGPFGP